MSTTRDGQTGRGQIVDKSGRAWVDAVDQSEEIDAAGRGECWQASMGNLTFTSANESGLIFLRNDSTRDLVVSGAYFNQSNSTGGVGHLVAKVYRDVATPSTAGNWEADVTQDAASSLRVINRNLDKKLTPRLVTVLAATAHEEALDGEELFDTFYSGYRFPLPLTSIIVPPGASIAFSLTPPAGNTSMTGKCHLVFYFRRERS